MTDEYEELWGISLEFKQILTREVAERISNALEELAISVSLNNSEAIEGDNWSIAVNTLGEPNLDDIYNIINSTVADIIDRTAITAEKLPEVDWLQHVYNNFPPIKTAKFFIHGSHYNEDIPQGLIALQIDAATAFGSGEHETTRGCIECLEFLINDKYTFNNALDMGCGSGILAIAMAKLWEHMKVSAVDIDEESIEVTKRYADINNVSTQINSQTGDGYKTPLVDKNAPYDIITANILANPLISMAAELAAVLKPEGFCILSGFLTKQHNDVIAAHENSGLKLIHTNTIGEWQAVIMQKQREA